MLANYRVNSQPEDASLVRFWPWQFDVWTNPPV